MTGIAVGLFSGIGGLEIGLEAGGFTTSLLCELSPTAGHVLRRRFTGADHHDDVTTLPDLPSDTAVLSAGFPCQDLSQAGRTGGIGGLRSGLVRHIFRLVQSSRPRTVLIENVPFMLNLHEGETMRLIVSAFEDEGYRWAWRVVDTNSFGLPQRRQRVIFVASLDIDPAAALLLEDAPFARPETDLSARAHGFYWTEGKRGLGWAVDAIPTLKNGSTVGIPSPPAILRTSGAVVKPHIEDAERLRGFAAGWTDVAEEVTASAARWTLVGNAVSVPVAEWAARRIAAAPAGKVPADRRLPFPSSGKLPKAAYDDRKGRVGVRASSDPVAVACDPLETFLRHPGTPLSRRATAGFLKRTETAEIRFPDGFLEKMSAHLAALG